jgi:phosphatidyl-myo-inositol alpha-mannosyltransferase
MRIGLVSPYSWTVPGGVNSHVEHLAAELDRRGHATWILAPVGVLVGRRRVDSRRLPATERLVPMGSAVPIRSNGSLAYLNASPRVVRRMDRALRLLKLDVLHVQEPFTPSVSVAAVLLAMSPVVGTFHAAMDDSAPYDRWGWGTRIVADGLDVRLAVSEAAMHLPAELFPGEYTIVPNGVATEVFAPARTGTKIPGRILFIGRAEPRKGLAVLLKAFTDLRRRRPEASLLIAGATTREVMVEASTAGDGVPIDLDGVTALGWVADAEKVRRLAEAEVVCVPSTHGESFGIVLIEALAAGVPVVASDLPGYRSVLRDGLAGRLTPPGEPVALAHALEVVLGDDVLRRRLRDEGIALAEAYSWSRIADRVEEVYVHAASLELPRGQHGQPERPRYSRAHVEYWLWKALMEFGLWKALSGRDEGAAKSPFGDTSDTVSASDEDDERGERAAYVGN